MGKSDTKYDTVQMSDCTPKSAPNLVWVHFIPNALNSHCGVADYSERIGKSMSKIFANLNCEYVVINRPVLKKNKTRSRKNFWEIAQEVIERLKEDQSLTAIVLHYSGYGYDNHGAPQWLSDELSEKPANLREVTICTVFHELFVPIKPWRRSFWWREKQKSVVRNISALSDVVITNRKENQVWLQQHLGKSKPSVALLPVPSNVGEPPHVPTYHGRSNHAVLFGAMKFKKAFLTGRYTSRVLKVCRKLRIDCVHNIGGPIAALSSKFRTCGVNVIDHGYLSSAAVSSILLDCRIAFYYYFSNSTEKSGVFAAYAAHGLGVCSVTPLDDIHVTCNLNSAKLTLQSVANRLNPNVATELFSDQSEALHRWYGDHTAEIQAKRIIELCQRSQANTGLRR